ncbi:MAG: hypothetical protein FWD37_05305 [Methanomassiliicoccaceae archaeon]|nr:hypothetical protein [Methanomassiliicoccaceae archaeon]
MTIGATTIINGEMIFGIANKILNRKKILELEKSEPETECSISSDKDIQGRIIVYGTPEQETIIRSVIENSFTVKEQKALVCKGDLIFRVTELPESVMAQYLGKKEKNTYVIEIDPEFIDNGITYLHEVIHHSRLVDDSRRTVLLRTRNERDDTTLIKNTDERTLEEAATILETLARSTPYEEPMVTSYYYLVASKNKARGFVLIKEDRELVAGSAEPGSKGLKGEHAKKAVEDNFETSHISNLRLEKKTAKERLKELTGDKE